ncbi:MAG: hypothetical protein GWP19_05005 [Planctomycetia bacterium]|nr:hypothetical protein [Planctomycetia bacterium]
MKYKNFDEWFVRTAYYHGGIGMRGPLLDAWDAAVEGLPVDTTKADIIELRKIIDGTMKIDCTCDKKQIASGYRCGCGKASAVNKAINNLSEYLKGLK